MLSRVQPSIVDYNYLLINKKLSIGISDKAWTNETNINNYCGLSGCTIKTKVKDREKIGLDSLLDKYKNEIKRDIKDVKQFDSLSLESDNVKIYTPKTKEESCHYGRGTKWCTASTKGQNMFNQYNRQGQLYIIVYSKLTSIKILFY